jgi:hypothetical protein
MNTNITMTRGFSKYIKTRMNFNKNMLKFKSTYETQSLKNEKMN